MCGPCPSITRGGRRECRQHAGQRLRVRAQKKGWKKAGEGQVQDSDGPPRCKRELTRPRPRREGHGRHLSRHAQQPRKRFNLSEPLRSVGAPLRSAREESTHTALGQTAPPALRRAIAQRNRAFAQRSAVRSQSFRELDSEAPPRGLRLRFRFLSSRLLRGFCSRGFSERCHVPRDVRLPFPKGAQRRPFGASRAKPGQAGPSPSPSLPPLLEPIKVSGKKSDLLLSCFLLLPCLARTENASGQLLCLAICWCAAVEMFAAVPLKHRLNYMEKHMHLIGVRDKIY